MHKWLQQVRARSARFRGPMHRPEAAATEVRVPVPEASPEPQAIEARGDGSSSRISLPE